MIGSFFDGTTGNHIIELNFSYNKDDHEKYAAIHFGIIGDNNDLNISSFSKGNENYQLFGYNLDLCNNLDSNDFKRIHERVY